MAGIPEGFNTPHPQIHVSNGDKAIALYKKAMAAGMKEAMPPTDMFWGDRMSAMSDPFGHQWNLATFKRRVR